MPKEKWSYNSLGCEDCCDGRDNRCRPYFPCCIRNMAVIFTASVFEDDGFGSGDPTYAVVSRMTVTNNVGGQESVDWSTFNFIDSRLIIGTERILFGGVGGSGCTFGIDIEPQDWFCAVGENPITPDAFIVQVTVCNPHSTPIVVRDLIEQSSFCLSFSTAGPRRCCLRQTGGTAGLEISIPAGGSFVFKHEYSQADWECSSGDSSCIGCRNICLTRGPDVLLTHTAFLPDDKYGQACLSPIVCVDEEPVPGWENFGVKIDSDRCDDAQCPPCGCLPDANNGCACWDDDTKAGTNGCEAGKNLGNCGNPKQIAAAPCSVASGGGQVCESINNGFGVGARLFEIWSGCTRILTVGRLVGSTSWRLILFDSDGTAAASVTVAAPGTPNCAFYEVGWTIDNVAGGDVTLTVDGNSNTTTIHNPYGSLGDGTCYALAEPGESYALI